TVAWSPQRFAHDLSIRRTTGKVILGAGTGGRQSVSGNVATVFGCSGFLGRYLVSKLARKGTQVIVPYRGEYDDIRHLKVTGDLGQVVPMRFDLRHSTSIAECVRHSDIVYNLIGRDYDTKNFKLNDVQVTGARAIAEACMENDVARLVHVSALNNSADSPSAFLRSKYAGEQAVREICPDATIVRPATMFGHEDHFFNFIAGKNRGRIFVNNQEQRIRPVFVQDVALALEVMLKAESTIGGTYELYGQTTYGQIEELVYELLLERKERLRLPKFAAQLIGRIQGMLPWPMPNEDNVIRMFLDDKPTKGARTFADLYIEPAKVEDMALQFVRGYRSSVYYERAPPETAQFRQPKPTGKVYHTIW
ncbi:NADH-ubiquinone oxidoreductase-like protein 40 kDa subunit, partial [Thamnocephalis sphaerospora]